MGETLRAVLWQGIFRPGAEWRQPSSSAASWRLSGTALVAVGDDPSIARYDIVLAADWSTRDARITTRAGLDQRERSLHLRSEGGQWRIEREPGSEPTVPRDDLESSRGLVDIDLGFTPATNTLPIRRLAPAIGETVDVTAPWVRFPEPTIEPLPQRHTRLSHGRYRYESAGGVFVTKLDVDDLGLVITYERGWQRIAAAGPSTAIHS